MIEREVKLSFHSPEQARAAVVAAGAVALRARRLQDDALYDTTKNDLRERQCVLRVRREDGQTVLTFKGPTQPSTMKLREEHETAVADGDVLTRVLEALGLHVWFRYQKFREEYTATDVVIAIDETPVGTFIEIEGGEHGILAMTGALGRSADEFILDSYRSLFAQRAEGLGLAGRDMLFPVA